MRELIHENILQKKIVGSAILCSLNYKNEVTVALLVLISTQEKQKYLEKIKKTESLEIEEFIKIADEESVLSAFIHNSTLNIICNNPEDFRDIGFKDYKLRIMNRTDFILSVNRLDFEKITILYGHEQFWKLVSKMA